MGYIDYSVHTTGSSVSYVAFNASSEQIPAVLSVNVPQHPVKCGELERTLDPPFQARIEARGRQRSDKVTIRIFEDGAEVAKATSYGTALAECTYGVTT